MSSVAECGACVVVWQRVLNVAECGIMTECGE